jgi:hypothetical protein
MKKSVFLFSLLLSLILWSCGSSGTKEKASEAQDPEETLTVTHEEAMMNILGEMNIAIPEELKYDRGGENYIYFNADSVTIELKEKLDEYYIQLRTDLKNSGWAERVLEENVDLGGISNRYAFEKPRPQNDGKRQMIVSTKYFEDFSKYQLGFQYKP